MRSILMIALSMILTIQLVGQESNRKQELKQERKDHFENTVHPFITKEHNAFLESMERADRELLTELKAKKAEMQIKRKEIKEKRKESEIPTNISREEFHELMKAKKAERGEAAENFKMDLMYLTHKYQDELKEHLEVIKAEKAKWKEEGKAKRQQARDLSEADRGKMKRKMAHKKHKGKKGRKFASKFLLWDDNVENHREMRSQSNRLNKSEMDRELVAYPNPVSDVLSLEFNSETEEDVNVIVLNSNGQIMISEDYSGLNRGTTQLSIDVSTLRSGTYIYKIQGENIKESGQFQVVDK